MSALETQTQAPPQPAPREAITIGKTVVLTESGKEAEIFTMTLGGETIDLLPLRNWSQLDVYKWGAAREAARNSGRFGNHFRPRKGSR